MKNTTQNLILGSSLAVALSFSSCGKAPETAASSSSASAPAAAEAAAPAGDMEEIVPEFPKPMFIGTPVPAELPNLEKPDPDKVVKVLKVPKGTVLLS